MRPASSKQDRNSGIRNGIFHKKHSDAIGEAIYLWGWLVDRQTKSNGLVAGGHHFTYEEITRETNWPRRTLQRWMSKLERRGYVAVKKTSYSRMIIWILNPKKRFAVHQLELPMASAPHVAHLKGATSGVLAAPHMAHSDTKSGALKQRSEFGTDRTKTISRERRNLLEEKSGLVLALRESAKRAKEGGLPLRPDTQQRLENRLREVERKLADLEPQAAVAAAG